MKTLKEVEKYLTKQHVVMLLSDDEHEVNIGKMYSLHGKRAASLFFAAVEFFKTNPYIMTLDEGFECYRKAAEKASPKKAKNKALLVHAVDEAPDYLSWSKWKFKKQPWTIELGKLKADEWYSLGNMLFYIVFNKYIDDDRYDNCVRIGIEGCFRLFKEVQEKMGRKAS